MSDYMVAIALETESRGQFDDLPVIHTGVGKVNAAYQLTRMIYQKKPKLIVNLGTAGSQIFETGSIVCCNKFVQRDIDVSPLGFDKYKTPYSDHEVIFEYGHKIESVPTGICGTGDNFDTSLGEHIYQLVDMEAYALAQVCHAENIPFLCLKYISDGADDRAHQNWQPSLEDASKKLREVFSQLDLNSLMV